MFRGYVSFKPSKSDSCKYIRPTKENILHMILLFFDDKVLYVEIYVV